MERDGRESKENIKCVYLERQGIKWDGHRGATWEISVRRAFGADRVGLLSSKPRAGTLFCRQQGDSTGFLEEEQCD